MSTYKELSYEEAMLLNKVGARIEFTREFYSGWVSCGPYFQEAVDAVLPLQQHGKPSFRVEVE